MSFSKNENNSCYGKTTIWLLTQIVKVSVIGNGYLICQLMRMPMRTISGNKLVVF